MWNGHPGRINRAYHHIELLLLAATPVCSAPYRARPKIWEFKKAEIGKKLAENITEPAQAKRQLQ